MRTAEIHLGELPFLPRAARASLGQEDVALPSSPLAVEARSSAHLEEKVKVALLSESVQESDKSLPEEHNGDSNSSVGLPQKSFTGAQG